MKCERIVWLDSCSHEGWHDPTGTKYKPVRCTTFGHVVHEDDKSITLAASVESKNQVCSAMTIPKVVIVKRVRLRKASK